MLLPRQGRTFCLNVGRKHATLKSARQSNRNTVHQKPKNDSFTTENIFAKYAAIQATPPSIASKDNKALSCIANSPMKSNSERHTKTSKKLWEIMKRKARNESFHGGLRF